MRHFVNLHRVIGDCPMTSIAEVGPGKSLGTGLAALLSGADRLYAFDLLEYTNVAGNVPVFDDLVDLFRAASPIPGDEEFPRVLPRLSSYEFPYDALPKDRLSHLLSEERLSHIHDALRHGVSSGPSHISYVAPWDERDPAPGESVDVLFSQAVMLYVADLDRAYGAMARWLRPGGVMSHTINFTSIGFTSGWDEHWKYSAEDWRKVEGEQPYGISRLPLSAHVRAMEAAGFDIIDTGSETTAPTLGSQQYHSSFAFLTDADRRTSRSVIVARKR